MKGWVRLGENASRTSPNRVAPDNKNVYFNWFKIG